MLIDDDRAKRDGVVALIRALPGYDVVATSAEIEEVLGKVTASSPDVVLIDLGGKGDDRLTLAGALHGRAPRSRVIIMGLHQPEVDLVAFVRAGVSGFIMADASFQHLIRVVGLVAGGTRVLPEELTRSLFGQLNGRGRRRRRFTAPEFSRLTNRQRDVAALLVQGLSNRAIALKLRIAVETVKSHVHKVLSKLAVNSRLDLAAISDV
jgi:DNA-binding NarL/FixJ family response regulator